MSFRPAWDIPFKVNVFALQLERWLSGYSHLLLLQRIQVPFSVPPWLTNIHDSSSRRADASSDI